MSTHSFIISPDEGPCWVCGESTSWVHLDFEAFLHLDCEDEAWRQYFEALAR